MLAYLNPSTSSSAHTSPRQLPTSAVPGSSAPSALHLESRSSAPSSTCPSPRFPPRQAPHPATPPSSTIAKAFPRKVVAGGKIPRLSLGSAGSGARAAAPIQPGEASRSRRCATVQDALREFESILMGDEDSSDDDSDGTQVKAYVKRGVGTADAGSDSDDVPDLVIDQATVAGPSAAAASSKKQDAKRNMGWSAGVAREFARFQLMVDVPVWTPECGADLSTLHQLRDTTLLALHTIIDDLRLRGIHTSYRICSTPSSARSLPTDPQGPTAPVWGCIRVAPPFHSRTTSQLATGGNDFALPAPAFAAPGGRSLAYLSQTRRSTMGPASATPSSMLGAGGFTGSASVSTGGLTGAGARSAMGSDDASAVVRAELEAHKAALGQLFVEEGQSFLVALHGQPALVLT